MPDRVLRRSNEELDLGGAVAAAVGGGEVLDVLDSEGPGFTASEEGQELPDAGNAPEAQPVVVGAGGPVVRAAGDCRGSSDRSGVHHP